MSSIGKTINAITLTINGQELEVESRTTVLEASRKG